MYTKVTQKNEPGKVKIKIIQSTFWAHTFMSFFVMVLLIFLDLNPYLFDVDNPDMEI